MARGVDEIHQVWHSSVSRIIVERQGDPRALDGHAALLLILAAMRESPLAGCLGTDDSGPGDQGVRQRGLAVVHVSDDAQGPDPLCVVHDASHLLNCEGRHGGETPGSPWIRGILILEPLPCFGGLENPYSQKGPITWKLGVPMHIRPLSSSKVVSTPGQLVTSLNLGNTNYG